MKHLTPQRPQLIKKIRCTVAHLQLGHNYVPFDESSWVR